MHWGYEKDNGPSTWYKEYKCANGHHQSPVDIKPCDAKFDKHLTKEPLSVHYSKEKNLCIVNNGHSVTAKIEKVSTIKGGPLDHVHKLVQFHLHWGRDDKEGSEHTIDGKTYPAELHFVHYNQEMYSSFEEAADKEDGLAVFGIFLEIGKKHKEFEKFTECLECVKLPDNHEHIQGHFDLSCLLPDLDKYWTYPGSLTTPPCYESVTWIVFEEPIKVSEEQIKSLRSLHRDDAGDHIGHNFRPTCALNDRHIKASFKHDK